LGNFGDKGFGVEWTGGGVIDSFCGGCCDGVTVCLTREGEGEEEEEGLKCDLGREVEVGINKPGMSSREKSPSFERSTFLSGGITNSRIHFSDLSLS